MRECPHLTITAPDPWLTQDPKLRSLNEPCPRPGLETAIPIRARAVLLAVRRCFISFQWKLGRLQMAQAASRCLA